MAILKARVDILAGLTYPIATSRGWSGPGECTKPAGRAVATGRASRSRGAEAAEGFASVGRELVSTAARGRETQERRPRHEDPQYLLRKISHSSGPSPRNLHAIRAAHRGRRPLADSKRHFAEL